MMSAATFQEVNVQGQLGIQAAKCKNEQENLDSAFWNLAAAIIAAACSGPWAWLVCAGGLAWLAAAQVGANHAYDQLKRCQGAPGY
jgi:hypothetical protein